MAEQLEVLSGRYRDLEERKRKEAAGYQTDVKLMQHKLKVVEQQVSRAAISKIKGEKDYVAYSGRTVWKLE